MFNFREVSLHVAGILYSCMDLNQTDAFVHLWAPLPSTEDWIFENSHF